MANFGELHTTSAPNRCQPALPCNWHGVIMFASCPEPGGVFKCHKLVRHGSNLSAKGTLFTASSFLGNKYYGSQSGNVFDLGNLGLLRNPINLLEFGQEAKFHCSAHSVIIAIQKKGQAKIQGHGVWAETRRKPAKLWCNFQGVAIVLLGSHQLAPPCDCGNEFLFHLPLNLKRSLSCSLKHTLILLRLWIVILHFLYFSLQWKQNSVHAATAYRNRYNRLNLGQCCQLRMAVARTHLLYHLSLENL